MGQASSRRAHGSARRRSDNETIPSPVTTAVDSLRGPRSTEGTTTSPSLTIADPTEAVPPVTPSRVTWPTSEEGDVMQTGQKSNPRRIVRSMPTKSTVRQRLSRMLPTRFHPTSHIKNPRVPIPTEVASSSTSQSSKEHAPVPSAPSEPSAPDTTIAPNRVSSLPLDPPSEIHSSSATVGIPTGSTDEARDCILENAPVPQSQADSSTPSHSGSPSPDTGSASDSLVPLVSPVSHGSTSDDPERSLDKGKQKAEPEPANEQDPDNPSTSSPSSHPPPYVDSLQGERRAATERVLGVVRPADASEDARTAQNLPPPEIVERIVDHLRSTGDPEILAALPRSPTGDRLSAGGNMLYPTRGINEPHPEPSITSGTAMIVQGKSHHYRCTIAWFDDI